MATKEDVNCDYLLNDGSCQALSHGKEGRGVRDESCTNVAKNLCCYLCKKHETCEISCNYLVKPETVASSKQEVEKEIAKTRTAIEKLALLLAEGRISEQSYLGSVKALEARIEKLSPDAETLPSRYIAPNTIPTAQYFKGGSYRDANSFVVLDPFLLWPSRRFSRLHRHKRS